MCVEHDKPAGISRRGMGAVLAGAAGLSLFPFVARAADVATLCVTCIDYRFVQKDITWLNTELGLEFDNYDLVVLAGAALAATDQRPRVPQNPSAFWDQIKIAIKLHKIKKVVLLDHMECGAYREAFGQPPNDPKLPPAQEMAKHREIMLEVAHALKAAPYNLQVANYVMPLEGMPIPMPS